MAQYQKQQAKSGGGGLLLLVLLLLGTGLVAYADTPLAHAVRERLQLALSAENGQQLLSVFGGSAPEAAPAVEAGGQIAFPKADGGPDDLLGRAQTTFPDTVAGEMPPIDFAYLMPAAGVVSSSFGGRISPTTRQPGFHYGLDIAAAEGSPIVSFADGTVREAGIHQSYGNYLILDHADDFATLYAHCAALKAEKGQTVSRGAEIATMGQSGEATGVHLHFELWHKGAALDPAYYLNGV